MCQTENRVCCCSYQGGGWGWQNWGTGCHRTWTDSATTWAPRFCESLSGSWHCGWALDLMHYRSDMSALSQSACSSLQAGSHTHLTPPQCDWRQYSQTWAYSDWELPPHHSRSPSQPKQDSGVAVEDRTRQVGEKNLQQRIYPCLQSRWFLMKL